MENQIIGPRLFVKELEKSLEIAEAKGIEPNSRKRKHIKI
jgi:hypothetical protein